MISVQAVAAPADGSLQEGGDFARGCRPGWSCQTVSLRFCQITKALNRYPKFDIIR